MLISRIAPTPSGFLHIGNAVNFLLTSSLTTQSGGMLHLRIDDADAPRIRQAYIDDIFWMLDWLEINIDEGPSDTDGLLRTHSQRHKLDYYRSELAKSAELQNLVYTCSCSRKSLKTLGPGEPHPTECPQGPGPADTGETALRVRVPANEHQVVDGQEINIRAAMGDFVLWRRDDLPAYQLVSVIEDRDAGINFVVRGQDLRESTAAQLFLAPHLGAEAFGRGSFVHHILMLDTAGNKLSKSQRSEGSLRDLSKADLTRAREQVTATVARVMEPS